MRNTHPNKVNLFIDGEYKADCENKINYNTGKLRNNEDDALYNSITGGTADQYLPFSSGKYKILPRSIHNFHTKSTKLINFLIF